MNRIVVGLAAFGIAALLGSPVGCRAEDKPSSKEKMMLKAVVHVNFADSDRQKHGLKNVSNILKEVKGEAEIVVICHGAGIDLLVKERSQHADERIERDEYQPDGEIEQDRTDHAMIGDVSRGEHGTRCNPYDRRRDDEPGGRVQENIEDGITPDVMQHEGGDQQRDGGRDGQDRQQAA